jgi:hypothetical protein
MSNPGTIERQLAFTCRKEAPRMRYVCLIYFDPKKVFDQSPEANRRNRPS